MYYYGTKISEHISIREPEGYMICLHVPLARTGAQVYLARELMDTDNEAIHEMDGDAHVTVYRDAVDVFDKATIASFEGMPVTFYHPASLVTADNASCVSCGHAQNIRQGQGEEKDLLIGDLLITNPNLIDAVMKKGMREISCGYSYTLEEQGGRFYQRCIRGNHVAVVEEGRAGPRVAINDQKPKEERSSKTTMKNNQNNPKKAPFVHRFFASFAKDEETTKEDIEKALDEILPEDEGEKAAPPAQAEEKTSATDGDVPCVDETAAKVDTLITLVTRLVTALENKGADEAAPQEDPMETLEKELAPAAAEGDTDPTDPESAMVDPTEVAHDTDIPEAEEKPLATDEAVRGALRVLKPILAKMPAEHQKVAADAAVAELRRMAGRDAKPKVNSYAHVKKGTAAKATDSNPKDFGRELGEKIMAARNANAKK